MASKDGIIRMHGKMPAHDFGEGLNRLNYEGF